MRPVIGFLILPSFQLSCNFAAVGHPRNKKEVCVCVLTWRLAVVGEVGHEQRLRVDHHQRVGGDAVHAAQRAQLGRPRELRVARNRHVAEVHLRYTRGLQYT